MLPPKRETAAAAQACLPSPPQSTQFSAREAQQIVLAQPVQHFRGSSEGTQLVWGLLSALRISRSLIAGQLTLERRWMSTTNYKTDNKSFPQKLMSWRSVKLCPYGTKVISEHQVVPERLSVGRVLLIVDAPCPFGSLCATEIT